MSWCWTSPEMNGITLEDLEAGESSVNRIYNSFCKLDGLPEVHPDSSKADRLDTLAPPESTWAIATTPGNGETTWAALPHYMFLPTRREVMRQTLAKAQLMQKEAAAIDDAEKVAEGLEGATR